MATKLSFFELYIAKTSVFAFSWLKHVALSFIAQKKCFGLFAVKLCVCCSDIAPEKVFFQFAGSPPNFSLILLKTTFSSLSGYATLFLTICFWEQAFPFFGTKTALLTFYLTQTIFGLVGTKLEAASFMSQKAVIWLFGRKHAVLSFIGWKICFG